MIHSKMEILLLEIIMKKILLALILLGSSSLMAANWKYIATANTNTVSYIDTESIQRNGDIVKFWVLFDFRNSTTRDPFYQDKTEAKALQMTSCKRKESTIVYEIFYYKNGDNISNTYNINWRPIVPGSAEDEIYKAVCKGR